MFAPAKGTRDLLPQEKILMQRVVDALRGVFEVYGYSPLETPCLEDAALLESKYGGGAEIIKETYRLTDRGGRELGLRYDLTVPLARVVAANRQLPKPFKRYEIGKAWRDGPVKMGRYREFWQCDVDAVGSASMLADAEIIALTETAFEKLGLSAVIKVNNRKLLNGVLQAAGIPKSDWNSVLQSLDKLEKQGEAAVRRELAAKKTGKPAAEAIFKTLALPLEKISAVSDLAAEGARELREFFEYAEKLGVKNAAWDAFLARGLDYYTGTVFEAYLKDSAITSAVAAGGRFDEMIAKFGGLEKPLPAVGISFGLDVIMDSLRSKAKAAKTVAGVFVIPVGEVGPALEACRMLRAAGVKTDVDLVGRGLSKNLEYANSLEIPYCVIIGPKDAAAGTATVRNMRTGEQKSVKTADLPEFFKKHSASVSYNSQEKTK